MRRTMSLVLGALLMLVFLAGPAGHAAAFFEGEVCADSEELAFLTLINDYRAANGLGPLGLSRTLSAAADAHSQDMAANDFLGHDGSNGSQPQDRFVDHGYNSFNKFAENVFAGDEKAAGAFAWWQSSPGHNANMLDPNLKAIGIGRAFDAGSMFGWYWTTTFGSTDDGGACTTPGEEALPPVDPPAMQTPNRNIEGEADPQGGDPSTVGPATGTVNNSGNGNSGDGVGCVDGEEAAFLTLINEYRVANGLKPLALSRNLSAAADAHSQDMATNGFFSHDGSNGSQPQERFRDHGYTDFTRFGENIVAGHEVAADALAAWQASPGHNASMLDPKFNAIGIGRVFDANSPFGWYWTTTFGSTDDGSTCSGPAPNGQRTIEPNNSDVQSNGGSDGTDTDAGAPSNSGDIEDDTEPEGDSDVDDETGLGPGDDTDGDTDMDGDEDVDTDDETGGEDDMDMEDDTSTDGETTDDTGDDGVEEDEEA